jgi:hypothetical protein
VGQAIADFYPSVTIAGRAGIASADLSTLAEPTARLWSIGPSIRIPIFHGGSLAAARLEKAALVDAATATYVQVVFVALGEIADALAGVGARQAARDRQREAVAAATRSVELAGTVIADPNSFGRVQAGHSGHIEAPSGGLPFIGKRVKKGDLLARLHHHIEAYDKGNMQGEIAELQEKIKLHEDRLGRYLKAPEAFPRAKIEETRQELEAMRQKRKQLVPTLSEGEDIHAPVSGVISARVQV